MAAIDSVTASAPMGLTMSNLGMGMGLGVGMGLSASAQSTGSGKLDDAERRRRLETVSTMLGGRSSRISQEGVERLARSLFQEVEREEGMGTNQNTSYVMAGNSVAVIVEFEGKSSAVVDKVELQYHGLSHTVEEDAEAGAAILKHDLQAASGAVPINATLGRFARNLERLSRMDKLSMPGANCFEAISGIHTSLKRLYEHERKIVGSLVGDHSTGIKPSGDREVLRKKSGRPRMQAHDTMGLSVDYWDRASLSNQAPEKASSSPGAGTGLMIDDLNDGATYSMTLECEHSSPAFYPTIRTSEDWLSESITKPAGSGADDFQDPMNLDADVAETSDTKANSDTTAFEGVANISLDWRDIPTPMMTSVEPDPFTSATTENGILGPVQSQARFIARLNPPLTLPLHLASQVYASVGVDLSQDASTWQSLPGWDNIVLPTHWTSNTITLEQSPTTFSPRQIHANRIVSTPFVPASPSVESAQKSWSVNLHISSSSRSVAARTIDTIPFSHPRQLIELLPLLRQWAFLTYVLQQCFGTHSDAPPADGNSKDFGGSGHPVNGGSPTHSMKDDTAFLNDLLNPAGAGPPSSPPRILDISLQLPQPSKDTVQNTLDPGREPQREDLRPALTFTFAKGDSVCRLKIEIGLNAEVLCTSLENGASEESDRDSAMGGQGFLAADKDQGAQDLREKKQRQVAQGLAISEDLVLWAEWVRCKVLRLE
ncbi:MAG: hypothetical protein M1828_000817 [Chrysothrix sp. TS-e1954]|nr:MAG: hypothetical protein M1828_000817 [Chrysothrix sp. TS-e1954]